MEKIDSKLQSAISPVPTSGQHRYSKTNGQNGDMGGIFRLRVYYHSAGSQAQKIIYNTKPQILFSKFLFLVSKLNLYFITNNKIPKKM